MRRRDFLSSGASLLAPARRPNVIIIMTDDQGYGDLSIHGNPHLKTPNLDSIGAGGARFTEFHSSPVCSPTRASLMTGRWNYRTGVIDTYLGRSMMRPSEVTLPEILSKAGYKTGIFGKWHLGDNYPMRSIDKGFQESLVCKGGGLAQPSGPPENGYFDPVLEEQGQSVKKSGYCTDIFFDHALEFIERHRRDPFFLYVTPNAPHTPLQIDEKWVAPFRGTGLDDTTARLYGMVANIDHNTGRLLQRLRQTGLDQDTLLIYLTDNGPQQPRYNAGMRGLKGSVYQGGIRVPCFWRWPARITPGAKIDTIAAHVDLLPSIASVCGAASPRDRIIDGRNLWPLLEGQPGWTKRNLFFQWHRGDTPEFGRGCAVRDERFKLVGLKELYDLDADPAESNNVAGSQPERAVEMRHAYERWYTDVCSQGFAPPPIHIGSSAEPVSVLTRQDWRGAAGWDADSIGYWEVLIEKPGRYDVKLDFPAAATNSQALLHSGGVRREAPVPVGQTSVEWNNVNFTSGLQRVEPWLMQGAQKLGVHYVTFRRARQN